MTVSVLKDNINNIVTIQVSGLFDYSYYSLFRNAYIDASSQGTRFILNLSNTHYMDSSALGMILMLKEHADQLSGSVEITKTTKEVYHILQIANFDQLISIESAA